MLFMIRGDNVTAHATAPAKPPKNALLIGSAKALEASDLPAARLVAIWNALPSIIATPSARIFSANGSSALPGRYRGSSSLPSSSSPI